MPDAQHHDNGRGRFETTEEQLLKKSEDSKHENNERRDMLEILLQVHLLYYTSSI